MSSLALCFIGTKTAFFDVVGISHCLCSDVSFCMLHFATSYSTLAQISNLFDKTIPSTTSLDGDSMKAPSVNDAFPITPTTTTKVTLMKRLEELGWDLQSRLYLGFPSRRLHVTVKND